MDTLVIAGNTAVVTGAASGIGRALALALARAGAELALADIDEEGVAETGRLAEAAGARVLTRRLDAGAMDENAGLAEAVFAWTRAPVTLVFANAGIHGLTSSLDPDLDVWTRAIRVNLMGMVNASKAFVPRLVAQGLPAQFVVTASQASVVAAPGMAPYVATKHAAWGFADSLRLELAKAKSPVGASIVAPGRTISAITIGQRERLRAAQGDAAAAAYDAQLVTAEQVAEVVVREVVQRPFWIVPSRDDVVSMLERRVRDYVDAVPAGRIA